MKNLKPLLTAALVLAGAMASPLTQGATKLSGCGQLGQNLKSQTLNFGLYHSKLPGQLATTEHSFRVSGSQFKIDSVSTAEGLLALFYSGQLTQHSEGFIDRKKGLEPAYYSEKRGKKAQQETVVNADLNQVEFRKNGAISPWTRGTQDRLSMIYQISSLLNCQQDLPDDARIELNVMTTGRVEAEIFEHSGLELLEFGTPASSKQVVKFSNQPQEGDDQIHLWFDPNQNYLPVQIQVQDPKGKRVTQTLIGYSIEPVAQ